MTPETQKALEVFVLQIIDAAKVGATWSADQAPILVQQWLAYQWYTSLLAIATFGVIGILLVIFMVRGWICDDDMGAGLLGILSGVGLIPALIIVALNVDNLIKLTVAPNVVVFEKFLEILK